MITGKCFCSGRVVAWRFWRGPFALVTCAGVIWDGKASARSDGAAPLDCRTDVVSTWGSSVYCVVLELAVNL